MHRLETHSYPVYLDCLPHTYLPMLLQQQYIYIYIYIYTSQLKALLLAMDGVWIEFDFWVWIPYHIGIWVI
jgi:hypothetical protein